MPPSCMLHRSHHLVGRADAHPFPFPLQNFDEKTGKRTDLDDDHRGGEGGGMA